MGSGEALPGKGGGRRPGLKGPKERSKRRLMSKERGGAGWRTVHSSFGWDPNLRPKRQTFGKSIQPMVKGV